MTRLAAQSNLRENIIANDSHAASTRCYTSFRQSVHYYCLPSPDILQPDPLFPIANEKAMIAACSLQSAAEISRLCGSGHAWIVDCGVL
jgi:hypothetical protein